jgi:1,2-diacylglycerol 3-beta-galactosyltransferase
VTKDPGLILIICIYFYLIRTAVDKVFVPSDVLHEKARSCGLSDSQIIQHGLPIRKGFWSSDSENRTYGSNKGSSTSQEKSTVQKKLGLDERPTVLVVGGGDGMCGIVDIASSLGKKLGQRSSDGETQQYQMVVICGNNQQAKQKLRSNEWPGVTVHVEGFISNMDEYMRAATCIVTKAGPGTIAEASICGLPCMLFAYL